MLGQQGRSSDYRQEGDKFLTACAPVPLFEEPLVPVTADITIGTTNEAFAVSPNVPTG
jgi:hypothetical protein